MEVKGEKLVEYLFCPSLAWIGLKFVPDCYKNQKGCNKAVDNYANALDFASDFFKTQKSV